LLLPSNACAPHLGCMIHIAWQSLAVWLIQYCLTYLAISEVMTARMA